jgi:hypothetical protein
MLKIKTWNFRRLQEILVTLSAVVRKMFMPNTSAIPTEERDQRPTAEISLKWN